MIEAISNVIGYILICAGGFFLLTGAIGVMRMPDFFSRLHPAGIIDSLGVSLVLIGLMFIAGFNLVTAKLLLILLFLLLTSPTACHALAKAAWISGKKPVGTQERGTLPAADRVKPQPDTMQNPEKGKR